MRSPTMTIHSLAAVLASLAAIGLHAPAWAGDRGEGTAMPFAAAMVQAPAKADTAAAFPRGGLGRALSPAVLGELRGGESTIQIEVRDDGRVDGNTANGVVSGGNIIGGGAFANASGLSVVIQNSGSNVLIQNGTAINVQFVNPVP